MRSKKPKVREPGTTEAPVEDQNAGQAGAQSDPDAAIAAAQSGKARRIAKPRAPVAPSKTKGDPDRPAAAPVNAKKEVTYAEAMKKYQATVELFALLDNGPPSGAEARKAYDAQVAELQTRSMKRSILTEQGWVAMPNRRAPTRAN
jgi:hypothetical protein